MDPETRNESEVERIGPFLVLRRLASSGPREAFLATDDGDRQVVLKVLDAPHLGDGLLDPKIADDASSYARLSHPNLVKVVELFSSGGRLLIALESVEGSTLNVVRAALLRGQHKLDDACWLYVASCIFGGLAAAHAAVGADGKAAPIVHGNVNPSNVHVTWDGAIKLGDFGVASIGDATRDSSSALAWGGHGYSAPEQANGGPVGPPADVYSATLVLWELLAGRKAIERGAESATGALDRRSAPSFPSLDRLRPDVDARVREVVRAGLQPDPSKRSVDAARVCEVLRSVADAEAARRRFTTALAEIRSENGRASGVTLVAAAAVTRRPPPVPPPRKPLAKPPVPVRPEPIEVELDVEPDPESTQPTIHSAPRLPAAVTVRRRRSLPIAGVAMLGAVVLVAGAAVALLVPRGSARAAHREEAPLTATTPAAAELESNAATAAPIASAAAPVASAPAPVASAPAPVATEPAPAATAPAPAATAPAPAGDVPAEPSPAPAAVEDAIPPDVGELRMPPEAAGHRIYVDGRTVSEGAEAVRVSCGPHTVRIGSAGRAQRVDVPCGAALPLTR
jgi:serine/threonine-protein kinase